MRQWIARKLEENPNRSVPETLGLSLHTHHDCEANQFFHLGHFVIQSLLLHISSGLRTPNHLCERDDGRLRSAAAAYAHRSYNAVTVFKQTPIKGLSPQNHLGPLLLLELQRANVKESLCEVWQRRGGWCSENNVQEWRPPKIVALHESAYLYLNKTEIRFYLYFRSVWHKTFMHKLWQPSQDLL